MGMEISYFIVCSYCIEMLTIQINHQTSRKNRSRTHALELEFEQVSFVESFFQHHAVLHRSKPARALIASKKDRSQISLCSDSECANQRVMAL